MIFTLSSIHFLVVSLSLTEYGEPHPPTINRTTFRLLKMHPLAQESLGEGNEPYLTEKDH
jgi:hypothetical protein